MPNKIDFTRLFATETYLATDYFVSGYAVIFEVMLKLRPISD